MPTGGFMFYHLLLPTTWAPTFIDRLTWTYILQACLVGGVRGHSIAYLPLYYFYITFLRATVELPFTFTSIFTNIDAKRRSTSFWNQEEPLLTFLGVGGKKEGQ